MSGSELITLLSIGLGLMTAIATGISAGLVRVVTLVLQQSKDTVTSVQSERDYWREQAMACREKRDASE